MNTLYFIIGNGQFNSNENQLVLGERKTPYVKLKNGASALIQHTDTRNIVIFILGWNEKWKSKTTFEGLILHIQATTVVYYRSRNDFQSMKYT